MIQVKDKKKFELVLAVFYFLIAVFLIDFFLTKTNTNGVWEWAFVCILFFFIAPAVLTKFVFLKKLKEQYFSFSLTKKSALRSGVGLFLVVAIACPFVLYLDWKQYVSVSRWALGGTDFLLFIDLTLTPLVLFSKEFFFRSFMLKKFIPVLGICGAIFSQSLLSVFFESYLSGFHVAWQQIVLLFVITSFLGYISWINKSVFFSTLLIWVYTIVIDLFFIYQKTNSLG
jgi:membrane protease YdiL (CAAX protease family)